ncbi:MAG: methionine aminopeptidase, type I [Candidatus Roizmanbacteria bacterium GW2011_GWA2_36_23]|uniref:Methionine aminopeptidase n=1 Tax=Candidatus Roizmanbacteria bacterium GW2011_GWA2_36_23 TaxID=1618480 RepID=A0A0G0EM28_9BACT|nr:MAG: methionine aminopeptidase, type I [Candidatus Roizmanbacteria bacterium GW2011_GWA2_36_23]
MIDLKTVKEIEVMGEGGKRLREVVNELLNKIKVGMMTEEIDTEAEKLIVSKGGESSFKKVDNYFWSTCLPVNEQVVHTPPSKRRLMNGDVLTVDIGMYYKGFHTDFATTLIVGETENNRIIPFLDTGKNALYKAIKQVRIGNRLGHISQTIEKEICGNGYFIMKQLTGHGIGRKLHEDPFVLGYLDRSIEKTLLIKPGLVIAIEVIYSMGSEDIFHEKNDDWSIRSKDSSLTACFEHTVAVTEKETIVLT